MALTSVNNAVSVLELEEVVIGSQLKISIQFERLVSENPETFEGIDFTGMTLKAEIKLRPSKDVTAVAEFVCTTRAEPGWVDLTLDGDVTGLLLERKYESSLKVWPTNSPELGDTLIAIILPMKYRATR